MKKPGLLRKGKSLLWVGVLALLLVSLAFQATSAVADGLDPSGWHIETVDSEYGCQHTSLALDGDGYPHISYYDPSDKDLRYAHQDASGWHTEAVDSEWHVGMYTSLALDGNGDPRISYFDDTYGDLKYAYQDDFGWHVETVGDGGRYTSLALDEYGYSHVSHYFLGGALHYSYQDASGWHNEQLDNELGRYTSLALNEDGRVHISYYRYWDDAHSWGLWYRYNQCPNTIHGWCRDVIELEAGEYNSLALDENGYPHISYLDDTTHEMLKYAYQDATGWYTETVDSDGYVGRYTSLALDEGGYAHISYYDSDNYDLKYAYQDAAGWHIETVDSDGYVGSYTSLALDGNGYPRISYCGGGSLKYACYLFGDLDGDGDVDVDDIMQVAGRWRMTEADPDWDARYDLNDDGIITVVDIMLVVAHWGETCE